jgi:hypothetical protein
MVIGSAPPFDAFAMHSYMSAVSPLPPRDEAILTWVARSDMMILLSDVQWSPGVEKAQNVAGMG